MSEVSGQANMEYYPSGMIKSYVTMVREEFLISGQYVKVTQGSEIFFHQNGRVKSLRLAAKTKFKIGRAKLVFFENDKIDFLESGRIKVDALVAKRSLAQDPLSILAAKLLDFFKNRLSKSEHRRQILWGGLSLKKRTS